MKFKFRPYTLLLVPQDSKRVFKIKIPFHGFLIGLAIAGIALIFLLYVLFDYFYIIGEFRNIDDIQARNRKLGKQLYS